MRTRHITLLLHYLVENYNINVLFIGTFNFILYLILPSFETILFSSCNKVLSSQISFSFFMLCLFFENLAVKKIIIIIIIHSHQQSLSMFDIYTHFNTFYIYIYQNKKIVKNIYHYL